MKDDLIDIAVEQIRVGSLSSAINTVTKQIAQDSEMVSATEILVRRELCPYVLPDKLPQEVLGTVIGHIKEQHKMLLEAKGYLE